jgi:hypothetical protein
MSKYPLIIPTLVMLVACGPRVRHGVSISPAFQHLVPADAQALADVRLESIEQTTVFKNAAAHFNFSVPPALAGLTNALVVWNGKQVVALARVPTEDLSKKLASYGQPTRSGSYALWVSGGNAIAAVNKEIAVVGPQALVQEELRMVDRKAGNIPADLSGQLENIPSDSQLWAVSRGGSSSFAVRSNTDVGSVLSNVIYDVKYTALGIHIDNGVTLRGRVLCTSPDTGKRVHDALRAAIGFARLSTNDRALLPAYDAIHVDQNGAIVTIAADLSGTQVDALLNALPKRQ